MKRQELYCGDYLSELKQWCREERNKRELDDLVQHAEQQHRATPNINHDSVKERLVWLYNNIGRIRYSNIIVDPEATAESIKLENSVIFLPYENCHLHIPGRHNLAISTENILARMFSARFVLQRNNAAINGNYEVNNVYYTSGEIAPFSPPAILFAESAEFMFDSQSFAKITDGNGGIRRYKNGTMTLTGAVITLDEISRKYGFNSDKSRVRFTKNTANSGSREIHIGFYGHLARNPIVGSY